ncbi:type II toxin-antitoxin system PemK/MazF family toxin [Candidatus Peregrinibacteria bacterium]|nr:type II toxin-antitoxin system PemK/MazF family toxin [Candidatus Peregrinibacteria bacterium]
MMYEPGDIVLIPFPYTNLQSSKNRPAIVIYCDGHVSDVIVLAITSQKYGKKKVLLNNNKLSFGVLPLDSYVRYDKVATLHSSLIHRKVARVKKAELQNILRLFRSQF